MKYGINQKRLIKTFVDLVKISSPSWHEQGVLNYIMKTLKPLPVSFKKHPCGDSHNLLVSIKGTTAAKPMLLSAHMDTVEPCGGVVPVITDKKISSDGTTILGSDDKSAIAQFIEAMRYITENNVPHGPIEFLFTCAEEIGLYGAKGFDMSSLRSKKAFVFDCDGSPGRIILKAPYHATMIIKITGKAAHAGMEPEKGISAINVLAEIITSLPSGRLDHETTMNVGTISGGRATNIIAEEAECKLEVRSIDRKKLLAREREIREKVKSISSRTGARSKIIRNLEYSGFTIKKEAPIIKIVSRSLMDIGIEPSYEISGGGSDTNIFNRAGIRAVNLSCGMRKVHSTKEYILIKELVQGAEMALSLIENNR